MAEHEFEIGEKVTIAPPYDGLPLILQFQRHVRVAARPISGDNGTYVQVELDSAWPGNRFHHVPTGNVRHGWLDVRSL